MCGSGAEGTTAGLLRESQVQKKQHCSTLRQAQAGLHKKDTWAAVAEKPCPRVLTLESSLHPCLLPDQETEALRE